MHTNQLLNVEMRTFLKTRLSNLIASLILGFVFVNFSTGFVPMAALAACSDNAGQGVNWQNCRKRNLIMDGFNFSGSDFTRADLSASDLRNSNFSNVKFVKTNLVRASLAGSVSEGANFEGVTASRTDFSSGNYKNSSFAKAEISRSNFTNSNLENADMSKADFSRVNFLNANLKGVNLSFSNISRANLSGVLIDEAFSLEGSFMFLTKIEGLDLSALKGLAQWQIDMACGNDKTQLPEGLTRPETWPCNFSSAE